jgi:hypothetical protein
MKTLIRILSFSVFILLVSSCDIIDEPFARETVIDTTDTIKRKVLLEDYTGHTCINCPTAAVIAQEKKDLYGNKIVVMAVHAGYFALPQSDPYSTDFRTPAGNELDNFFGVSTQGLPKGMVNRMEYSGSRIIAPDKWGAAIGEIIDLPPDAYIELGLTYDQASRKLSGDCHVKFINQIDGTFRFCLCLIENNIVAAQKNNNQSIGTTPDWLNYVHQHVLRAAINGTWGEEINPGGPIETGLKYHLSFTNFEILPVWKYEDCAVVAFVFNADTKEVIQAEEMDIE